MRPPAEYLGLARALRWRVAAVDGVITPVLDRALAPLQARLQRHPRRPLREASLIDAARVWRSTPAYGRIGQSIDISDPRNPAFRELRVSAVRFSCDLWDGGDADGLAISLIMARRVRGRMELDPRILGAASLHAIARRIERSRDRSDTAVFEDLAVLALRWPQMIDHGADEFVLAAGDEGRWAGRLARLDGNVAALAQTWLSDVHAVTVPEPASMSLDELIDSLSGMEVRIE